jgi:hypothetical protein
VASFTAMSNLSNFNEQINPGVFYLFELGIYWELISLSTIIFNGLRLHGGCSPTYPVGYCPSKDAYRLCLVSYPSSALVDGNSQMALSSMPHNHLNLLSIPGEAMARPYQEFDKLLSEHANYVQDGGSIMVPEKHVEYIARTLLQLSHYVFSQLPEEYGAEVDRDRFLSSFSLKQPNKVRSSVSSWKAGPGWVGYEEERARVQIWEETRQLYEKMGHTIPSVVMASEGNLEKMVYGSLGPAITSMLLFYIRG